MTNLLSDFPPGPLDLYRKKASFDWKKLKTFVETEEMVKFENDVYEVIRQHPEFQQDTNPQSLDEQRRIAARGGLAYADIMKCVKKDDPNKWKKQIVLKRVMLQVATSSITKYSLGKDFFINGVKSQGTERHAKILREVVDGQIYGCFCLTEVGHGSNANAMKTTATYDAETHEFVMHTPNFQAAKCWISGLAKTAVYAVVYAQLYTKGTHYGLHAFVVPIRDPKTLLPYPGLIVGDIGEKIGLNGADNGFLIFDNYRIPRENLLNKYADVTPDGSYVTALKTSRENIRAALATLSLGRVEITGIAANCAIKALTIAIRYAAVRKQFGPDENEVPILEYQSHQYRLLPYLAAAYIVRLFGAFLFETTYQFISEFHQDQNDSLSAELATEIHVVSSASKPVSSWLSRDAIQECREACGGHGYLRAAGIGDIRNDNDANCTYEGENHVLIQQTSNWLLKLWSEIEKGRKISTPLKSADFLSSALQIIKHRFRAGSVDALCRPENIMDAYEWLVCYLLKETKSKLDALTEKQGEFWAKNNTQVFYAKSLATAFIQRFFLQRMLVMLSEATDTGIKNVLLKLFSLYGLWSLEKFLPILYEGGYAEGPKASRLIHETILKLCNDIKNDAVSLVDAIAPPDFILNSVLGASDGQVYRHLQSAFFCASESLRRPKWWGEIVNWKPVVTNKL